MLKRLFDFLVAGTALLLLAPVLLATGILVATCIGRPIMFKQIRPGLHARPFTLLKFRTMTDAQDAAGRLLPDAERLTPFGKRLRASSLDELPQLWNVVRGDLSLVGPRPLLMDYLPRYSSTEARRHEVRPGITGLAQVEGRNSLAWPEKFALDVWYVDNRSFLLDLRILMKTLTRVFRQEGVNEAGAATMTEFVGSTDKACGTPRDENQGRERTR